MNRYASIALTAAAFFLIVMAVLNDSPPLFYMGTAMVATLLAARLQAYLAVRYLRFERFAPPAVAVGEPVVIEMIVWSERRIKRPLVTVRDGLPESLRRQELAPPLPVAPSYEQPIRTRYEFRPLKRGRYRWSLVKVEASDALGLVYLSHKHRTEQAELTVYPAPLPVEVELNPTAGSGIAEVEAGRVRGSGLEPHAVREYVSGDPLRYIHWKSSARRDTLMVKEFDTGTSVSLAIVLDNRKATDVVDLEGSSLETLCGHALYLAESYLDRGAEVTFPQYEKVARGEHSELRIRQVREVLVDVQDDQIESLSAQLLRVAAPLAESTTVVILLALADPDLPAALTQLAHLQRVVLTLDAAEYDEKRAPQSASHPAYLQELESAGARVVPVARRRRSS